MAEQEIGKQLLAGHRELRRDQHVPPEVPAALLRGGNAGRHTAAAATTARIRRSPSKAKDDLALVLDAVKESKERHRAKFICDLLTGTETSEIKNYKGDKLKIYGKGTDKDHHHWMAVVPPGRWWAVSCTRTSRPTGT